MPGSRRARVPSEPRPHGRGGLTLASRLLPLEVRADVRALYGVFRTLDDLVDDGRPGAAAAVGAVERWAAGGPAEGRESQALAAVYARRGLPRQALLDFCAGMRHDLAGEPIHTEADLDRYCYRVAGTVGLTMTAVLGEGAPCAAEAVALGIALQRTNILRDVAEDGRAGRRYLAQETVARFEDDWEGLVRHQVARADRWYDAGLTGLPKLRRGRPAIAAAAVTYREILRMIERDPAAVLHRRTVVPTRRKLAVIARALAGAAPPATWQSATGMRAIQITSLDGPGAVELKDVPEPEPSHLMTPGEGVVVRVEAAGVSFPEVLQSRGEYQVKPDPPFTPGSEVAGTVVRTAGDARVSEGDRVVAFCMLGGFAEQAVAPHHFVFPLADGLDAAQGAGLVLNYHTAYFALKLRGRLAEGEKVLVHGAAGGVGTASIQVAKGLGASQVIAVVSTDEKERVARDAGADEVVRSDQNWREQAQELSGGGVDVVLDPVGGDRFTDSLRACAEAGRVVVVGFTGGSIPEVKVNRLLLRNTEVIGAGWGAYVMSKPKVNGEIQAALDELIASGHVKPIVGARFPLEQATDALELIDGRGALGKVVLEP